MKKTTGIIIAICVVVAIVVAAFVITKKNDEPELPTYNPQAASKVVAAQGDSQNSNVTKDDIKIVQDFTYTSDDECNAVAILENTGAGDAAVAVVAKAYDSKKSIVGTERETVFIDSGAQTVVQFEFDNPMDSIDNIEYSINASKATTITPGLKNIFFDTKKKGNVVNVTATNKGEYDLKSAKVNVLFYKDGNLVEAESDELGEDAGVFAKGATVTEGLDCDKDFDKTEVFFSQTLDK